MRKYTSGTRWCLWRWTEVDSEYIVRLHVLKTPWFAICLHWILKPDPEPYLHDHPVTFLSVVLRGGYYEARREPGDRMIRLLRHRWFNWIRASPDDRHTIVKVEPGTLTLCFMGPKTREWGFHVDSKYTERTGLGGTAGWVWWKHYYAEQRERLGKG